MFSSFSSLFIVLWKLHPIGLVESSLFTVNLSTRGFASFLETYEPLVRGYRARWKFPTGVPVTVFSIIYQATGRRGSLRAQKNIFRNSLLKKPLAGS